MPATELRTQMRQARRALPPQVRLQAANGLADQLLGLPFAPQRGYVAGYWAVDGEIPLHAWQLQLPPDCIWCLPVLDEADACLRFAPWRTGDATRPNRHGIPEPIFEAGSLLAAADMTFIALPLTAFDARGHRVGMGGGWYDRTLDGHVSGRGPRLVGVGYDVQRVDRIEPQPWDIRCDAICSESATYLVSP